MVGNDANAYASQDLLDSCSCVTNECEERQNRREKTIWDDDDDNQRIDHQVWANENEKQNRKKTKINQFWIEWWGRLVLTHKLRQFQETGPCFQIPCKIRMMIHSNNKTLSCSLILIKPIFSTKADEFVVEVVVIRTVCCWLDMIAVSLGNFLGFHFTTRSRNTQKNESRTEWLCAMVENGWIYSFNFDEKIVSNLSFFKKTPISQQRQDKWVLESAEKIKKWSSKVPT